MSDSNRDYNKCINTIKVDNTIVSVEHILSATVCTNRYINKTITKFEDIGFDLLESLGMRNLSGTIGEIFKHFLDKELNYFKLNPHADGRPDLLCVDTKKKLKYYKSGFAKDRNKVIPKKQIFTPFRYGGLEIKCTIGQHSFSKQQKSERDGKPYSLGETRVKSLKNILYMAHHRHDINLLGLLYDFYEKSKLRPQILAVFYSKIYRSDWKPVTNPTNNSKTTSATSILPNGIDRLKNNCVFYINDPLYATTYEKIGIGIK